MREVRKNTLLQLQRKAEAARNRAERATTDRALHKHTKRAWILNCAFYYARANVYPQLPMPSYL